MKLSPQITGNLGLFYSAYRLSLLGWNVMPTSRNARGVDIIAYSADATEFLGIQVKALSKRNPVPLGKSLDRCVGDFWIIVTGAANKDPTSFVMRPAEVRKLAHRGEKDGRISFWLQPSAYDRPEFKEKWERIGHGGLESESLPSTSDNELSPNLASPTSPADARAQGIQMSNVPSIESLLAFARKVEKQPLATGPRGKEFQVAVIGDHLEFTPASTGQPRAESRARLVSILDKMRESGSFERNDYNTMSRNSSYVLALIQLLQHAQE